MCPAKWASTRTNLVWGECGVAALIVILYGLMAARTGARERPSARIEREGDTIACSTKS